MQNNFCDGEVNLFPDFLSEAERSIYLERLKTEIEWKHEPILMFGKLVMQPRLTAWYGDPGARYRYSGMTQDPLMWIDALFKLKSKIEQQTGASFNAVLLNQYRNQKDSMGWHRDNEKELGLEPVIASLSLGETRRFLLRKHASVSTVRETEAIELTGGSLLIMKGRSQSEWEHSLPKTTQSRGLRINLTFRLIKSELS